MKPKRRPPIAQAPSSKRKRPIRKVPKKIRLPADPRPKALARYGAVTGHVFYDPQTGVVYLLTSDHRKVLAHLTIVRRYVSPRHEPGTEMVMYKAFLGDVEFVGRSAGLVLTLRPREAGMGFR